MILSMAMIQQERGWPVGVQDDNIDAAIIVDVSKSRATPRQQRHLCYTSRAGNILELSVVQVAKQEHRLRVMSLARHPIGLRIDVPCVQKNVQPTCVVHVEERRAPGDQRVSW